MTQIFLDIETTGLSFKDGHRIVEIACIETNELIPTKKIFHKDWPFLKKLGKCSKLFDLFTIVPPIRDF